MPSIVLMLQKILATYCEAQNGPKSWAPRAYFFLQTYESSSD